MVLVGDMHSVFAKSVGLILLLGCKANPSLAKSRAAATGIASTSAASANAASGVAPSTSASTAPTRAALTPAMLPEYPSVEKPLQDPCADPRAVLSVRKNHDRSGRIAVQQALVANPEFRVVPERAHAPLELDFYETIYGTKNFARKYPGDPMFSQAVIARCADVSTCNRAAAAFHAAFPSESIELVCGVPPKTTGGFSRVYELAAERLVVPGDKAPTPAFCARAQACLAREGSAARPKPDCAGIKRQKLTSCSELPSCGSVATCLAPELP